MQKSNIEQQERTKWHSRHEGDQKKFYILCLSNGEERTHSQIWMLDDFKTSDRKIQIFNE